MAWTLDDIYWHRFQPAQVDPSILRIVKTASLVEANSADYVAYLHNIFYDDEKFKQAISIWGAEEHMHGLALGRWAEKADPSFNFFECLNYFREGYRIPQDVSESVRGSRTGELLARCVVESGTSSFYSAIRDRAGEPCLKQICHKIAQDEFAHYRMFQDFIADYGLEYDRMLLWQRAKISFGRTFEANDDEISFAYYSANHALKEIIPEPYDVRKFGRAYLSLIYRIYERKHIKMAVRMIMRVIGLDPDRLPAKLCVTVVWAWFLARRKAVSRKEPA